jgi:hypothetical protein
MALARVCLSWRGLGTRTLNGRRGSPRPKSRDISWEVVKYHGFFLVDWGVMEPGDESGSLERLVTDLTARFTRLPVERIHEEIERGLRRLVVPRYRPEHVV